MRVRACCQGLSTYYASLSFYVGLCVLPCVLLLRGVARGRPEAWMGQLESVVEAQVHVHPYTTPEVVGWTALPVPAAMPKADEAQDRRRGPRQHVARPRQAPPANAVLCHCTFRAGSATPPAIHSPSILRPPLYIYDWPGRSFLFSVVGSTLIT